MLTHTTRTLSCTHTHTLTHAHAHTHAHTHIRSLSCAHFYIRAVTYTILSALFHALFLKQIISLTLKHTLFVHALLLAFFTYSLCTLFRAHSFGLPHTHTHTHAHRTLRP